MNETPTPRTDALFGHLFGLEADWTPNQKRAAYFARQLERELAEAKAKGEKLEADNRRLEKCAQDSYAREHQLREALEKYERTWDACDETPKLFYDARHTAHVALSLTPPPVVALEDVRPPVKALDLLSTAVSGAAFLDQYQKDLVQPHYDAARAELATFASKYPAP